MVFLIYEMLMILTVELIFCCYFYISATNEYSQVLNCVLQDSKPMAVEYTTFVHFYRNRQGICQSSITVKVMVWLICVVLA